MCSGSRFVGMYEGKELRILWFDPSEYFVYTRFHFGSFVSSKYMEAANYSIHEDLPQKVQLI